MGLQYNRSEIQRKSPRKGSSFPELFQILQTTKANLLSKERESSQRLKRLESNTECNSTVKNKQKNEGIKPVESNVKRKNKNQYKYLEGACDSIFFYRRLLQSHYNEVHDGKMPYE